MRRRAAGEDGGALIISMFLAGVALLLAFGVARLGSGVVGKARADLAADAAALAGADALALGHSAVDARTAASVTAAANGAELVSCECEGSAASVVVVVESGVGTAAVRIEARARADVRDSPPPTLWRRSGMK